MASGSLITITLKENIFIASLHTFYKMIFLEYYQGFFMKLTNR